MKNQEQRDSRIQKLHADAVTKINALKKIIDELKTLGPHSLDRSNAILNTQEQLAGLSERCKARTW